VVGNRRQANSRRWATAGTMGIMVGALAMPVSLAGQGAINPTIAPRAAALERDGRWDAAMELLGRYLATAPGDGEAWFQFGRLYLIGARQWHHAHAGEPGGYLYLDLAGIALDRSIELRVDSGVVFRSVVDMERGLITMEHLGWEATRDAGARSIGAALPGFILDLGANLMGSCPLNGVLVSGTELEDLAIWYAAVKLGRRADVFPFFPGRWSGDSLYRRQAARSLGVPDDANVARTLEALVVRRTICLTPMADSALLPAGTVRTPRLVLSVGPEAARADDILTVTELIKAEREHMTPWTDDVHRVYDAAGRRNRLLCVGILAYLTTDPSRGTCGQ